MSNEEGEQQPQPAKATNKNKRHRKDKPWDNENIDHWKIVPATPEDPLPPPIEESLFATQFPKYREKYIREIWPLVTSTLKQRGVGCELDLVEGSMTVKTTRKMYDPFAILKARDMIKLLARSIPVQQAVKIMEDDVQSDIIKIKNLVRNKERFAKRRQRLVGPNGCTLKALELVTGCYVMVQGNTVSAMGSYKGIKAVREVVEACMRNEHPVYHIKRLMIQKELAANPDLKNESWDRFLPNFKKKNVKRKKPAKIKEKKEGELLTPFPPKQTPRKVDLQLESGEYFLAPAEKAQKQADEKKAKHQEKAAGKRKKREEEFVAPQPQPKKAKAATTPTKQEASQELDRLKKKLSLAKAQKQPTAQDYLM